MQEFSRKYGVQTTIHFPLYETDGVAFKVDAADGGTDCNIMKDEGVETTCVNDFVDEGTGYSLVLTATEMEAAEIMIYVIDSAAKVYLDWPMKIETYGNASAMHAMDFDDAVRGGMTALPNAAANAAGGLPVSSAGGLDLDNDVNDQLEINHLDHLFKTTYDPAAKPGTADALLNELIESDAGVSRYTVNALEQGRGTNSANTTTPPTVTEIQAEMEENGASILDSISDLLPGSTIAAATDIPAMVGTNNAALASVVGALAEGAAAGDPTTGETLMQYIKQLINTLEGAVGIPVFPAESAPANNVSLAETIRAIAIDVAGLNGSAMIGTNSAALATGLSTHDGKLDAAQTDLDTLTDARGEPGQGALPVSAIFLLKIDYIYKCLLRNKRTSDDDSEDFFADDASTIDHRRTLSDDGSTFTKGEVGTGA